MNEHRRPTGHLFVAERRSGRFWYVKWRDADGQNQKRLGPAWVKAHGQTARGAVRWRTADGSKPAGYLTPDEARDALQKLLADAPRTPSPVNPYKQITLCQAADEWLRYEEYEAKVKHSTVMDYRNCAARLCREFPKNIPLEDISPQMIERWKTSFRAERRLAKGKLRRTEPSTRTIRST